MTINGLDAVVMFDTGSTSDAVSPEFAWVANMKIHSLDDSDQQFKSIDRSLMDWSEFLDFSDQQFKSNDQPTLLMVNGVIYQSWPHYHPTPLAH